MLNRLKRLHNPRAALDFIWRSTPSPGYEGEQETLAASSYRLSYRLKAAVAVQALVDNRSLEKSWARKKVEAALELELAWCRIALADTVRWAICSGLSYEDIQAVARSVPPVPASTIEREQLFRELTARFLLEQDDAKAALAIALHLHADLAPAFDITTLEQVAIAVNSHAMHKLSLSASVDAVLVGALAGTLLYFRFSVAEFASTVPEHWKAKSAAAAIAFAATSFLTKELVQLVAMSAGRQYALGVVRAKLKSACGGEPPTRLR